jgi:hypothetical protein
MDLVRRGIVFFCGFAMAAWVSVASEPTAQAHDPSANDCVDIDKSEQATGLSFELHNKCDRSLMCALNWTLVCESASGKTSASRAKGSRFALATNDKKTVQGSAEECKDSAGWRIEDVGWNCQPVK